MTGRVIVVGGGLAGLAAALHAADAGAQVELFERAPRLGGATWSFRRDGLSFDNGQHVFMRCCTEYRAFLDRIGSADKVVLQDRMRVPVHRPGRRPAELRRVALPAPLHLAPALTRYTPMRPADRIRAVRTALALRRLDPADPTLDTRTFGDWLAEHGASRQAIDALWNLVCLPTVNLPAAEASLMLAAKVFRTGLLDTSGGADIGWSAVPLEDLHAIPARRALEAGGAAVRTNAAVQAVRSDGRGPTVTIGGDSIEADAVIVAVPHQMVGALLPDGSFPTVDRVGGLGQSPIVNVHLLYDRPVFGGPFAAGIDSPVQFVFDRTTSAGAPPGHQCIAISLSAANEYLSWSRGQLVDRFSGEMVRLFPAAAEANVVTSMVTREVAATFRASPGSHSRRPPTGTQLPGVFLAGAWTDTGWPATMEGAVRSGGAAARAALAHVAASRPSSSGAAA